MPASTIIEQRVKAFAVANIQGTPAIVASVNMTLVSSSGGLYVFNMPAPMANTNYVVLANLEAANGTKYTVCIDDNYAKTTSQFRLVTMDAVTGTLGNVGLQELHVAVFA